MHTILPILILSIVVGLVVQQAQPNRQQSKQTPVSSNKTVKATDSKALPNKELKIAKIEDFFTYARSVPAEFSVDLFMQLLEAGEIKDLKRQQELLVELFYTAAKAKQPVKLIALPGSAVDSRAGYRATASQAGLDALSLQLRVIRLLLRTDSKKARELFSEIKIIVGPPNCESTLTTDFTTFFQTVQLLGSTAFDPAEVERRDHVYFVERHIAKIDSPSQFPAAVKALLSIETTDLELQTLGQTLSAALKNMRLDFHSFLALRNSPISSMEEMVARFNERGLSGDEIIEAYRTYVVNQLNGPRCDNGGNKEQKQFQARLIAHFNDNLRTSAYKKIPPISEDEIKPAKAEATSGDQVHWTSPKAQSLLARMRNLRFSTAGKDFSDEDKQSAEWQSQLSQLIRELAMWSAADERSEEDYFHQKSVIYYALLNTIPADSKHEGLLEEAFRDFAIMLSDSPLQRERPAEWFLHAKVLIDKVHKAPPRQREKLVNLINSSRSTVLHLYVQKHQLLGIN